MHRAGNRASALRTYELAGVFGVAACIHNDDRWIGEIALDLLDGGKAFRPGLHFEIAGLWNRCFMGDRQTCSLPGVEPAVENMHIMMSEEFQKPKQTRRSHSCNVVVCDNGAVVVHALCLNQVFDHPKERFKRLWPGVDKADSENIEAPGAGNVSVGIGFWRAHVHENELRIGEATFQVVHGPQQVRICIVHRSFSRECERGKGAAPSSPNKLMSSVITSIV